MSKCGKVSAISCIVLTDLFGATRSHTFERLSEPKTVSRYFRHTCTNVLVIRAGLRLEPQPHRSQKISEGQGRRACRLSLCLHHTSQSNCLSISGKGRTSTRLDYILPSPTTSMALFKSHCHALKTAIYPDKWSRRGKGITAGNGGVARGEWMTRRRLSVRCLRNTNIAEHLSPTLTLS